MPNWASNRVQLRGSHAVLTLLKAAAERSEFCQAVKPIPLALKVTMSGSVGDPVKQAQLDEQSEYNRITYGYANWYDFAVSEWGTKWDIGNEQVQWTTAAKNDYDESAEAELTFGFDSAWSPPIEIYEELTRLGVQVVATYWEPGMDFAGVYDNGDDRQYEGMNNQPDEFWEAGDGQMLDNDYNICEQLAQWAGDAEEDAVGIDLEQTE